MNDAYNIKICNKFACLAKSAYVSKICTEGAFDLSLAMPPSHHTRRNWRGKISHHDCVAYHQAAPGEVPRGMTARARLLHAPEKRGVQAAWRWNTLTTGVASVLDRAPPEGRAHGRLSPCTASCWRLRRHLVRVGARRAAYGGGTLAVSRPLRARYAINTLATTGVASVLD